jgi:hypothetical protein
MVSNKMLQFVFTHFLRNCLVVPNLSQRWAAYITYTNTELNFIQTPNKLAAYCSFFFNLE